MKTIHPKPTVKDFHTSLVKEMYSIENLWDSHLQKTAVAIPLDDITFMIRDIIDQAYALSGNQMLAFLENCSHRLRSLSSRSMIDKTKGQIRFHASLAATPALIKDIKKNKVLSERVKIHEHGRQVKNGLGGGPEWEYSMMCKSYLFNVFLQYHDVLVTRILGSIELMRRHKAIFPIACPR
ncbi:hypothetical protein [Corynebacterium mastitidis]|uniref:hypothetical protein n=1 Tax=Corynebacterium mastitidis TaxID=161890 RepID=UPI0012E9E2F9|nr:hypothetical protein [Corynebacterium mastitidis]